MVTMNVGDGDGCCDPSVVKWMFLSEGSLGMVVDGLGGNDSTLGLMRFCGCEISFAQSCAMRFFWYNVLIVACW